MLLLIKQVSSDQLPFLYVGMCPWYICADKYTKSVYLYAQIYLLKTGIFIYEKIYLVFLQMY